MFASCTLAALVTAVPFGYTLLKLPVMPDVSVTIETLVCVTVVTKVYAAIGFV